MSTRVKQILLYAQKQSLKRLVAGLHSDSDLIAFSHVSGTAGTQRLRGLANS